MTTVMQAAGLGKRYRRGVRVDAGLRHVLEEFARSPWPAAVKAVRWINEAVKPMPKVRGLWHRLAIRSLVAAD